MNELEKKLAYLDEWIKYFTLRSGLDVQQNIDIISGEVRLRITHPLFLDNEREPVIRMLYLLSIDYTDLAKRLEVIADYAIAKLKGPNATNIVKGLKEESERNKLIKRIKMAGQDLIDRADELAPLNVDRVTYFSIDINFPPDDNIDITSTASTVSEKERR